MCYLDACALHVLHGDVAGIMSNCHCLRSFPSSDTFSRKLIYHLKVRVEVRIQYVYAQDLLSEGASINVPSSVLLRSYSDGGT